MEQQESSSSNSNSCSPTTLGLSGLMEKPWSKTRWSNAVSGATENFFNFPSALFGEDDQQQKKKQKQKQQQRQNQSKKKVLPTDRVQDTGKRPCSKSNNKNNNSSVPTATTAPESLKAKGLEPPVSPTAVNETTDNYFNFSSTLFRKEDQNQQPRTKAKQRNVQGKGSGDRPHSSTPVSNARDSNFFNFPSALFQQGKDHVPPAINVQDEARSRDKTPPPTVSSCRSDCRASATSTNTKNRLNELEQEIDALGKRIRSRSDKSITNKSKIATTELVTRICLQLDSIEIPRHETAMRTKRKELLRKVEDLDRHHHHEAAKKSMTATATMKRNDSTDNAEDSVATELEDNPQITRAEEQFNEIEKEMDTLETKTKTNEMKKKVVSEHVTQLCCKLDSVEIPYPQASPGCSETNFSSLKARRKELLRRAESIEKQQIFLF